MTTSSPQGRRQRIVVLTRDTVAARMAGPAIRAWSMAERLGHEHEVVLAADGICELTSAPGFRVQAVADRDVRELVDWCSVFILQGYGLRRYPFIGDSRKVVVVDAYDPFQLEQLEFLKENDLAERCTVNRFTVETLNEQLLRADFAMCASTKQRDFWLGQMVAIGRVNPVTYDADASLESLLAVVPFGLPSEPPRHRAPAIKGVVPGIGVDDEVILWGGGIYNWFDPLTLLRAVDKLRVRRPSVRLYFLGLQHPNPEVPEMRMAVDTVRLAHELGLTGTHVFFNEGWVDFEERASYLLEASVGVSTHFVHLETAFSFRTRILDYLWAGLPIVATQGDSLATLVETEGLGATVAPEDVDALEEALFRVLNAEPADATARRARIAAVARRFQWGTVLAPLTAFCRQPRRAPDLVHPVTGPFLRRPEQVTLPPPRGLRQDVRIALGHLRTGGLRQLLKKARSRLEFVLAQRRRRQ